MTGADTVDSLSVQGGRTVYSGGRTHSFFVPQVRIFRSAESASIASSSLLCCDQAAFSSVGLIFSVPTEDNQGKRTMLGMLSAFKLASLNKLVQAVEVEHISLDALDQGRAH